MLLKKNFNRNEKGQVLVIAAVSLVVLLLVVGLAIDSTMLFLNYTRLKRAVDASSIAAANDFKKGASLERMRQAALEILTMHNIDTQTIDIQVFMCTYSGNPEVLDTTNLPTEFANACPLGGQLKKKLVYVRAFERSQTYFVTLIGVTWVPISTTSIAEAAPVDLVLVMDTSRSMGRDTVLNGVPQYSLDFDPSACNTGKYCQPLEKAKDAAQFLIDALYPGYDRVSIVTFDTMAATRFGFTGTDGGDLGRATTALDNNVALRVDPPISKLFWFNNADSRGWYNPINPEDRDNSGARTAGDLYNATADVEANTFVTPAGKTITLQCTPDAARWANGNPCDDPAVRDAFDWNGDKQFTGASTNDCTITPATTDHCASQQWIKNHTPSGMTPYLPMALVSTCTGCGMREATANLVKYGRSNAVWVIVFLSDGQTNMSDTPQTAPYNATTKAGVPDAYPNGFCGGWIDHTDTNSAITDTRKKPKWNYWYSLCIDAHPEERWCINEDPTTCPPEPWSYAARDAKFGLNTSKPLSPPYSAEDYARDMTDRAALQVKRAGSNEALGNDIAIYAVGFGEAAVDGAPLLRYMAAVGDDGNRETDPCKVSGVTLPPKQPCGQYYFAQTAEDLLPVFQDIATRIYTKISE
jgi:Flp pilus assembly protein TadG